MLDGVWAPSEEHLSSCHEEILRLTKLVDELGTLARYESDTLALNCVLFDLRQLAAQTAQNCESGAQKKDVLLTVLGEKTTVFADRNKIGQIIMNLLHNALKFTPEGGSISLEVKTEGNQAILSVRDTGCGIAAEDLPFIFERFYRADPSRNRDTGGSGIGLAIAQAIAKAHGGEISVKSAVGEGSTFTLALPNHQHPV